MKALQKFSDEFYKRLNREPLPVRIIKRKWGDACRLYDHMGRKYGRNWEDDSELVGWGRQTRDASAFCNRINAGILVGRMVSDLVYGIWTDDRISLYEIDGMTIALGDAGLAAEKVIGKSDRTMIHGTLNIPVDIHDVRMLAMETSGSVAEHAKLTARWIVVQDIMKTAGLTKGNPGQSLFEGIFAKGFWFIGPYKGESIIFVPTIQKPLG